MPSAAEGIRNSGTYLRASRLQNQSSGQAYSERFMRRISQPTLLKARRRFATRRGVARRRVSGGRCAQWRRQCSAGSTVRVREVSTRRNVGTRRSEKPPLPGMGGCSPMRCMAPM